MILISERDAHGRRQDAVLGPHLQQEPVKIGWPALGLIAILAVLYGVACAALGFSHAIADRHISPRVLGVTTAQATAAAEGK